ncbi:unnamed protein product [Rotaria socialis]|uniref:Uncharacterized protein n=2 Tax=Rotaria socialis TaxID=392032 RepID=A0A818CTX4_9BILA|nr:unnamed protein product [Rotaria socialis]
MAEQMNNDNANAPALSEETIQTAVLVVEIVNEGENDQNTIVMARNDEIAVPPPTPIQEPDIIIQTGNSQQLQEVSGPPVEYSSVFDNQPVESESHCDEPAVINLFAPRDEFFNMPSYEMELSSQIEDATDYDCAIHGFNSFSQQESYSVSIENYDETNDHSLSLLQSSVILSAASNDNTDEIQRTQVIQSTDNSHDREYTNLRLQFSTAQLSTIDEERLPGHGLHTEAAQSYSRTGSSCSDPPSEAADTRTQMQTATISPSLRRRSCSFEQTCISDFDVVSNKMIRKRRLSMQ